MAMINIEQREVHIKIVYVGRGSCGKTMNLQAIHKRIPKGDKTELICMANDIERILFFDFHYTKIGRLRGFKLRVHLYTAPGAILHRREVIHKTLNGADGIVFVADSTRYLLEENQREIKNVQDVLGWEGRDWATVPTVIQYNKRDLPNRAPIEVLEQHLNLFHWASFGAIAIAGIGVMETLDEICQQVARKL